MQENILHKNVFCHPVILIIFRHNEWRKQDNSLKLIFIDKKFGQFDHQIVQ